MIVDLTAETLCLDRRTGLSMPSTIHNELMSRSVPGINTQKVMERTTLNDARFQGLGKYLRLKVSLYQ